MSASVLRYPDGQLQEFGHYNAGEFADPPDGSPAQVECYPSGAIKKTRHFRSGSSHAPEDGSPANVYYFENGEISGGYSSEKGKLSPAKVSEMLKAAQVNRVASLLEKADQAVVPAGMPLPKDFAVAGAKIKTKGGR